MITFGQVGPHRYPLSSCYQFSIFGNFLPKWITDFSKMAQNARLYHQNFDPLISPNCNQCLMTEDFTFSAVDASWNFADSNKDSNAFNSSFNLAFSAFELPSN